MGYSGVRAAQRYVYNMLGKAKHCTNWYRMPAIGDNAKPIVFRVHSCGYSVPVGTRLTMGVKHWCAAL
jgi:hypothetical protein